MLLRHTRLCLAGVPCLAQRQAITKAGDLNEVGIDIDLLHMSKRGQKFDWSLFYNQIVSVPVSASSVDGDKHT